MKMISSQTQQLQLLSLILLVIAESNFAFQITRYSLTTPLSSASLGSPVIRSSSRINMASRQDEVIEEPHFLLEEFSTSTGEIINPYQVLKVPRDAEKKEIKDAYRKLSKRYHPDGVRFREVLPGKCDNHDDVRDEWERILLSYEILSDKKSRQRYNRHEFVADPGAAMQRAAMGAATSGVTNIGKGIFSIGASALNLIIGDNDQNNKDKNNNVE